MKYLIKFLLMFSLWFSVVCQASEATPIDQNQAMSELSEIFFLDKTLPIFDYDFINEKNMDYSITSLQYINAYLDEIRKHDELPNEDYFRIVLRTGAYVGEVLRRNEQNHDLNWIGYDQFSKMDYPQEIKGDQISYGTMAVLIDSNSNMVVFPLQKIEKYLQNGEEDSLKFFVEAAIEYMNKKE
ncbi:hypothetical protein SAMN05421749_104139 [Acinetobacter marinus]|uniref:Uncharacterized protein n=1 Tax=Acinetobacter marinus TaxID=281375 RepID=A0A1G6KPD6_9GAMM|nr:hypothetical protein [Acinetobacter marinus]SDC32962.1 hypothetical protein SAMN05421749_104139 [Acinetobacter marinus]